MLRMQQNGFLPPKVAFAAGCWLLAAAGFSYGNLHAAPEAIVVGDQKQLFIDDLFLKQPKQVDATDASCNQDWRANA